MSGLKEPQEFEPQEGALRLAPDDDVHDASAWEAATAAVLRKARRLGEDDPDSAVWEALARTTLDGIEVPPIGQAADLDGRVTSGRPGRVGAWDVRTPLEGGDAKEVNEAALVDLDNGATSLHLELEPGTDLAVALRGVLLDLAPVSLGRPDPEVSEALAALLDAAAGDPHPANNLSADPATAQAFGDPDDARASEEAFVRTVRRAQALGVLGGVVDGTALHDRGASDAQELGWTMAVGVHYLRLLTRAGLSVDEAAGLLEFRYAATDEQFPTIAKLRAARRLWARVLEASGAGQVPQRQHVVTSRPMMGRYDPWVNMLRSTVAAFAAGAGGADVVTVVPFDERLGRPDAFGRRIARNTSSLLIEESHVAVVTDPAGGSYAVERLTDELAVAGWAELGRIESDGGFGEQALAGVEQRVQQVVDRRNAGIADRSRPLTGISEFPHLGETLPERAPAPERDVRHYAAPYEQMRAEPAEHPVFLATMGSIAAHTARATFVSNLFAAGGVTVEVAGATDGPDAVLAQYAGQRVVCLAGTDAAYDEWGADLVAALRSAGASYVVLAGKPGGRSGIAVEGDDAVDDWAALGVDALAFLGRIREELSR
ncbi:methylmalonyl-CoA mutase [Nocardioides seonyuensis]|uniref:Methylmalonyl-CoA mutase n=1 Tax=Nocardioides seonyuensis TaxID=2518371 RepID=A0A4P7IG02_9ACTN|nr:methylmalonyl-CoA mutase family protein [Nocardioides seonyuensis]QBX56234.1 methylmalonyl-CoA mutase [Nocardioides seonyuensis]